MCGRAPAAQHRRVDGGGSEVGRPQVGDGRGDHLPVGIVMAAADDARRGPGARGGSRRSACRPRSRAGGRRSRRDRVNRWAGPRSPHRRTGRRVRAWTGTLPAAKMSHDVRPGSHVRRRLSLLLRGVDRRRALGRRHRGDPRSARPAEQGRGILDAPCGHGRIARRLAVAGMHVTGVDLTPAYLEQARDDRDFLPAR